MHQEMLILLLLTVATLSISVVPVSPIEIPIEVPIEDPGISDITSPTPLYRACVLNARGSVKSPPEMFGPGVGYLTLEEAISNVKDAANKTNRCDFILFPELALDQTIYKSRAEIVDVGKSPDDPRKPYQVALSKAAVEYNINVIFDFVEMGELCTPNTGGIYDMDCVQMDEDDLLHHTHNTVIVIDTEGVIVASDRKMNPMDGLEWYSPGSDVVTVTLKMPRSGGSVLFGVDIGFDMLHNTPILKLVDAGVKHLLHPARWINHRAGYADLPIFQGISEKYKLTVIASGTTLWASGSAVFQDGKILAAFSNDTNRILAVDVFENTPESTNRVATSGTNWKYPIEFINTKIFIAETSESRLFPVTSRAPVTVSMSSADGVTCVVTGKLKIMTSDRYIAYFRRNTPMVDLGLEDCGVQVCNTTVCNIDTAIDVNSTSLFNQLEIRLTYPKAVFESKQGFLSSSRMTNNLTCTFQSGYSFTQYEEKGMVIGSLVYKRTGKDNDPLVNAQVYRSFAVFG